MEPPHKAPAFYECKLQTLRSVSEYLKGAAYPKWPTEVFLESSNLCNLQCAMCQVFSDINPHRAQRLKRFPRGFFDLEKLGPALAPVLEHALFVHCFGFGEPTLHPQFRELIDFVSRFEVLIDFITNGVRIDQDLAEFLVSRHVYEVIFSLSGSTSGEYEAIYHGADFNQVMGNIRTLVRIRQSARSQWPRLRVYSLAFEHHIASLDRFVELMGASGINAVSLSPVIVDKDMLHLAHHAAVYQPSLHDDILRRAEAIAARYHMELDTRNWVRESASSSEEVRQIRAARISPSQVSPETLDRTPRVPLNDMKQHAQAVRQAGLDDPAPIETRAPVLGDTLAMVHQDNPSDLVLRKLHLSNVESSFRCPQPFSTLYVDVYGRTRPCCQSHARPSMGYLGATDALTIWRGVGFDMVRAAILNGRYPSFCDICMASGSAPRLPVHAHHALEYAKWLRSVYGQQIPRLLLYQLWAKDSEDDAIRVAENLRARRPDLAQIIQRHPCDTPERQAEAIATMERYLADAVRAGDEYGGIVHSWFDGVINNSLMGWVWSPMFPDLRLPVRVLFDGAVVVRGIADTFRGDLKKAGKGDGKCCFAFPLASLPSMDGVQDIRVYVGETDFAVNNSPLKTVPRDVTSQRS